MKKVKQRRFEYDLIRSMAMFLVILFHFNYTLMLHEIEGSFVIVHMGSNATIGGTALFIMLSGSVSCISFGGAGKGQSGLKHVLTYYGKRLLAMLPTLYVAYALVFLIFVQNKGDYGSNFYLTLLGLDGYFSMYGVPTSYLVGEWFLGAILILYILFPLLYKLISRYPRVTAVVAVIWLIVLIQCWKGPRLVSSLAAYQIVGFMAGIYYELYGRNLARRQLPAILLITMVITWIRQPFDNAYSQMIQGACFFVLLAYLGEYMQKNSHKWMEILRRVVAVCAKYSYAACLVHHVVINFMLRDYWSCAQSWGWYMGMFICTLAAIAVFSVPVQLLGSWLGKGIKKLCSACVQSGKTISTR